MIGIIRFAAAVHIAVVFTDAIASMASLRA
jgi:hypothetical protein